MYGVWRIDGIQKVISEEYHNFYYSKDNYISSAV